MSGPTIEDAIDAFVDNERLDAELAELRRKAALWDAYDATKAATGADLDRLAALVGVEPRHAGESDAGLRMRVAEQERGQR